jgi:ELWxxDGT repeat protein
MAVDKAGNTLKKARKLGAFDNGALSFKDAVSTSDKNDLFTLSLAGRSSFDLALSGLKSNADVEVFQLAGNKAKILKSIGSIDFGKLTKAALRKNIRSVAKSNLGAKTNEAINLNLNAGEYYVRVYQRQGNTKYTLNVAGHPDAAGEDPSTALQTNISDTPITYSDYVGKSDASDVYGFSIADARNVSLALNNLSADANLTLLNEAGAAIASSNNGGATSEAIAQQLAAGRYYVKVAPNGSNTQYSLQLSATAVPSPNPNPDPGPIPVPTPGPDPVPTPTPTPGDTLATAVNLNLTSGLVQRGSVNDTSKVDYYKFTTTTSNDLSLLMNDLTANANVELLDSNGAVLQTSAQGGVTSEKINYPLGTNTTYYLKVSQATAGTSTGYALNFTLPVDKYGDAEADATSFAISQNDDNPSTFSDYAGGISVGARFSEEDYFKFTIADNSQFRLILDQLTSNLDVEVYKQGASAVDRLISARTGTSKEEVGGNLSAGTYFVRIHPTISGTGSTYTLKMSADPTQGKPTITRDIAFGEAGSSVANVTNINGTVYFSASDGTSGLWKSNGTLDGTVKIKQLGNLGNFVNLNGTLYFTASGAGNDVELWKSDGTAAGTVLVKDLVAGSEGSNPEQLTAVGNNLYFWAATNPERKDQKFLYRGSVDNTGTMTVDEIINGGTYTDGSSEFTNVNGTLYYRALVETDVELLRINAAGQSDDPAPEIIRIPINGDPTQFIPSKATKLTAVGNSLFFVADSYYEGYELHRITNGSDVVTVFDVNGTTSASISNNNDERWRMALVGNTLYFSASGGAGDEELWKIANAETAAANSQVRVRENDNDPIPSNPLNLTSFNGKLFFTAEAGADGRELWSSSGTQSGTQLLKDINTNPNATSSPDELTVAGGFLYFSADDGDSSTNGGTSGRELWQTDGTVNGTKLVMDINPGGSSESGMYSPESSNPVNLTVANGKLYFVADNGEDLNGKELWVIP